MSAAAIPMIAAAAATPVAPLASFSIFDPVMETKVAALCARDERFAKEVLEFLKPEHFSNSVERNVVHLSQEFLRKYRALPQPHTLYRSIKDDKRVSPAEHAIYGAKIVELVGTDLKEREFIRENVVNFCQKQALLLYASQVPDLINKPDGIARLKGLHTKAMLIGEGTQVQFLDYLAAAHDRRLRRDDIASGAFIPGVSTGIPELDAELYHKGLGRGELAVFMAPSKRGKTAAMLQMAALSAVTKGSNVLYVSLEVSEEIMGDRLDACLTSTEMTGLLDARDTIEKSIFGLAAGAVGKIWLERRPSNSFSIPQLEAMLEAYSNAGHHLDMVVVDYIGIMRLTTPEDRFLGLGMATKDLRRLAGEFNVAMVTGAQTNRDAVGKQVAGMDSIGESFAIVQDCDLLISINANEAEMASGVRRFFLAASRNSPEVTIKVQGDLGKMQIVQRVIEVTR